MSYEEETSLHFPSDFFNQGLSEKSCICLFRKLLQFCILLSFHIQHLSICLVDLILRHGNGFVGVQRPCPREIKFLMIRSKAPSCIPFSLNQLFSWKRSLQILHQALHATFVDIWSNLHHRIDPLFHGSNWNSTYINPVCIANRSTMDGWILQEC